MKRKALAVLVNTVFISMATPSFAADLGPSTTTAPYMRPLATGVEFISILTTGDIVDGYKMGGIPDGLGAYDNEDGTFTVLMNHEIFTDSSGPLGLVRAHGAKGAYVSAWVIDKKNLEVKSGQDLMKRVLQLDPTNTWVDVPLTGTLGKTRAFARFCSADLAERSAFFYRGSGTPHRIFLTGEESAPTYQRGVAHVATGPEAGTSYVLPWAADANASWENLLANPAASERTVVIGNADGGTQGIYVYVGTKSKTGNAVERAGLVGGSLYRVAITVKGVKADETRDADAGLGLSVNTRGNYEGPFSLVPGPDKTSAASTRFLRPEDGSWDTQDSNRYFFVTTDRMDAAKNANVNPDIPAGQVGRSRLWALNFIDSTHPELGGSIELLLDGTGAKGDYQMFDNITVNRDGTLVLQEDVGNNIHNGKIWQFNPTTGELVKIAGFDAALFGDIGVPGTITKDEETSGVIDITKILDRDDGRIYNLFVVQNHAVSNDPETLEGGQLLLMSSPSRDKKRN